MSFITDYTMNMTEQQYHDYPAWSYSLIAKYARNGFAAINTLHDKVNPTPEMKFGSLLDCILTRGLNTAEHTYAVLSDVPAHAVKAVLDRLVPLHKPYEELTDEEFETAMNECNFYPNYKFETKRKYLDACVGYYSVLSSGLIPVSQEDWDDALTMARNIKTDSYLKDIFGVGKKGSKEYVYQAQFLTNMTLPSGTSVDVKCMPDVMIFDHEQKTIQLVDLKSSSMPAFDFADQFVRMRYDIEASVYATIVSKKFEDTQYADYTILPYLFVDISRSDKVPVTYEYDWSAQSDGLAFKNYSYKNWQTLLDEILEYEASAAVVPSYIRTDGPNDLLSLLNRNNNATTD